MDNENKLTGEISRRLLWAPFRALTILSGLVFLRGIFVLIVRFCLFFRRKAVLSAQKGFIILDEEWWFLGQKIRTSSTEFPLHDIAAVRYENRQRYLYLLVGFGSLAVGTWLGIHWFVDGLRAGYPNLALVGAGVILAGVAIDVVLYLFYPKGQGKKVVTLAMGPWAFRLSGVDPKAASQFLENIENHWRHGAVKTS